MGNHMTETKPVTLETISRQLEETQAAIREIRNQLRENIARVQNIEINIDRTREMVRKVTKMSES
jgi:predicted  nucleic acid-binding Zn-ribbon protein